MDVICERHESLPIAAGSVPLSKSSGPAKEQYAPVSDDVGHSVAPQPHTHVPIEIELTSPARPSRKMILGSRPQAHAHGVQQCNGDGGRKTSNGVCHAMRLKSYSALVPQSARL